MHKIVEKLGWIGFAVLMVGLILYSVEDFWTLPAKIATIAGAAILVMGVVINFQKILAAFRTRSALMGAQSLLSVILFIGILGLLNFLAQRHPKRWDLTAGGEFSLSDQTENVVRGLKQDITIKAFFDGGEYAPVKDMLVEYKGLSPRISYEFIDPNKQPQQARQYEVKVFGTYSNPFTGSAAKYGTLIVETAGRLEKIEKSQEPLAEQDLTNALIKVTREGTKTACFLEGHGEKGIEDQEADGLSRAKAQLEKENFQIKSFNLVRENSVPPDCAVVVAAGSNTAWFPQEIELLKNYLTVGGAVLMMLDPEPAPGFADFLREWGIEVGADVVVDASGVGRLLGAGPEIPLVTKYGSHRITEKLDGSMSFFPLARSVRPASAPPSGVTVEKLLETHPRSWGETGALTGGPIQFDEGRDLEGPVSLGVAASKDVAAKMDSEGKPADGGPKKTRLVVVGDSDFGSNAYFDQQGNGNLLMNMVNWLAAEEDLISIRPKDPKDKRVVLSARQSSMLFYLSVVTLPVLVVIAGVSVWLRRKRL